MEELLWNRRPKPNRLGSARIGDAGEGTDKLGCLSDRQTAVRLHQRCPPLPPRPARVSLCPHALRRAELDTRGFVLMALREPSGLEEKSFVGGKFQVFSLLSCGSAALTVAAWSVPSVKGTAASCRRHSRGSGTGELPGALAHTSHGGLLFYCCKFHAVLICQQCCLVGK